MSPALGCGAVLMGGTSLLLQVLLVRELLTSFFGNELAIAVILLSWMLTVAAGSWLTGRIRPGAAGVSSFAGAQVLLAVVIPLELLVSRAVGGRTMFPGEVTTGPQILWLAALTVGPGCLVLGAQFALACRLAEQAVGDRAVSLIYALEALGALALGIAFHFVLAGRVSAGSACLGLSVANALGALWLLASGPPLRGARHRLLGVLAAALVVAGFTSLVSPGVRHDLDERGLQFRWRGLGLVTSVDSRFGNLAVTRNQSQVSLFQDGSLLFTSDDAEANEWGAHLPLLQVARPRDVLVIGIGNPALTREILRHPVSSLTVVEIDARLADLAQRWFGSSAASGDRLRVIVADARAVLQATSHTYDAIIVNVHDPSTAALNRYYTVEFFELARRRLNPSGVLALRLSAHEAYLIAERKLIHAGIHRALSARFADVLAVPGYDVQFLASNRRGGILRSPEALGERLQRRRISTQFVNAFTLANALMPFKIDLYAQSIAGADARANQDLRPVTYYNFLRLWLRQYAGSGLRVLPWIEGALRGSVWFLGAALLAGLAGTHRGLTARGARVAVVTAAVGFVEMSLQLSVILGFQILVGYVYHQIGILTALNMGGLAIGGWLSGRPWLDKRCAKAIPLLVVGICGLAYGFGAGLPGLGHALPVVPLVLGLVSVINGILGGMAFPLAVSLMGDRRAQARTGSWLYAWDLLGGAASAAVVGMLVIPVLGLTATSVVVGNVGIAGLLVVLPVCLKRVRSVG